VKSFLASYPGVILKILDEAGALVVEEIIQTILDKNYTVKKDDKKPNHESRNGEKKLHQRIRNHLRSARPLMVKGFVKQATSGKYSITEKGKRYYSTTFETPTGKAIREVTDSAESPEILGDLENELTKLFPEWHVQGLRQFIVMGPPGTGKTRLGKKIVDSGMLVSGDTPLDYPDLQRRYCAFLQFHPSYSYDDFVEGLRPTQSIENELLFDVKRGPFSRMCASALNSAVPGKLVGRIIEFPTHSIAHLISCGFEQIELVDVKDSQINKRFENIEVESDSSISHVKAPDISSEEGHQFFLRLKDGLFPIEGDTIPEIFKSSDAPDMAYLDEVESKDRDVWLLSDKLSVIGQALLNIKTLTLTSKQMFGNYSDTEYRYLQPKELHYVVIDEINRANISEVFGELLVQLEYRLGSEMDISVELPSSGTKLVVPNNLVLIGLMNHADKSLARLDRAFIRRFHIVELLPDPSVLKGTTIQGVDLQLLMTVLNDKLELVTGGDIGAQLGHSYFLRAKDDPSGKALLRIWYFEVLPIVMDYCGHGVEDVISLGLFPGVSIRNSNVSVFAKTILSDFFGVIKTALEDHLAQKNKAA
jgi:hypothetical protein